VLGVRHTPWPIFIFDEQKQIWNPINRDLQQKSEALYQGVRIIRRSVASSYVWQLA